MTQEYAHAEALVSTQWVDDHRGQTERVRIVESNEDILLYDTGHIPEAVHIDWINDLNDPIVRDYIDEKRFAEMCGRHGIGRDTTVVFYGDKSNWWACYAFWVFKLYGHPDCRIMNGGRKKWGLEGRPISMDAPTVKGQRYPIPVRDLSMRAFREDALTYSRERLPLIDVRSAQEFSGERTHMPEYPQEGVLRGGHIPGAVSIPWSRAVNDDGTFKSRPELDAIYLGEAGLNVDDKVIAYCRIGERSSHTWFVLKYLLGLERVRNYDGSWTEWGNTVGMPIENPYRVQHAVESVHA